MKVICLKIPPTKVSIKLEVSEILEAFQGTNNRESLFVFDSNRNLIPCDALDNSLYFKTLQDYRNNKINLIFE